jgi:copper chaperone CopZ
VEEVELIGPDDVEPLRFLGSPTVHVDGVDIEQAARVRTDYAMSCRLYNTPDGLPSRDMLLAALDAVHTGPIGEQPERPGASGSVHCCETSEAFEPRAVLRRSPGVSSSLVATGGSLVAAMLSSACCWLPLLLVAFGASAAGVSALFGPWRPFFIVAAVTMLALSFYLTFVRKQVAQCCSTGGSSRRRLGRATWWVSAVIVAAFVYFPQYVGLALGGASRHIAAGASESQSPSREFTFRIEGMHCEACATSLNAILSKIDGVARANVDYATETAHVWVTDEQATARVLDATRQAGFSTSLDSRSNTP